MPSHLIIQEQKRRTHDGRDVQHNRSDVGFKTCDEAEAWVEQ